MDIISGRYEGWWRWLFVALYLLIPIDMLTTMVIVADRGASVEANPLMRWLYQQGILWVVVVNLVALVTVAVGFRIVISIKERISDPYDRYFGIIVELWLGLVVALGLFIYVNNMSVIVFGSSLV